MEFYPSDSLIFIWSILLLKNYKGYSESSRSLRSLLEGRISLILTNLAPVLSLWFSISFRTSDSNTFGQNWIMWFLNPCLLTLYRYAAFLHITLLGIVSVFGSMIVYFSLLIRSFTLSEGTHSVNSFSANYKVEGSKFGWKMRRSLIIFGALNPSNWKYALTQNSIFW